MIENIQLSEEQKAIIEAPPDEKTIVMAVAASGKTRCVTERLRYLLNLGIDPSKIVTLTFTNNAAAEMQSRIEDSLRGDPPTFMGTIHSYANMLLSGKYDTSWCRDEEEFDELFNMVYEHPEVMREIDYLIVDETQDLNQAQFDFIEQLDAKGWLLVGDVRQSIYGFKGATPQQMLNYMRQDETVVRELTQNYRNSTKILDYSNKIIGQMKGIALTPTVAMRHDKGNIQRIRQFDILPTIAKAPNWGDWAILCRSNKAINAIMAMLNRKSIPCITFRQAQGNLEELKERVNANAVKVLTIHSAKGLEFPKVIVVDVYKSGDENIRLNYVSVTRARDELYLVMK